MEKQNLSDCQHDWFTTRDENILICGFCKCAKNLRTGEILPPGAFKMPFSAEED